jgi:hypothetical protein
MPNRFVTATLLVLRPLVEAPASWVLARRWKVRRKTARKITRLGFTGLQLLQTVRRTTRGL